MITQEYDGGKIWVVEKWIVLMTTQSVYDQIFEFEFLFFFEILVINGNLCVIDKRKMAYTNNSKPDRN